MEQRPRRLSDSEALHRYAAWHAGSALDQMDLWAENEALRRRIRELEQATPTCDQIDKEQAHGRQRALRRDQIRTRIDGLRMILDQAHPIEEGWPDREWFERLEMTLWAILRLSDEERKDKV